MASSWFTTKVNLSTIVSQGLEHVNKLKDDVEKQFDEAVSGKSAVKAPVMPFVQGNSTLSTSTDLFHEAAPMIPVQEEKPSEVLGLDATSYVANESTGDVIQLQNEDNGISSPNPNIFNSTSIQEEVTSESSPDAVALVINSIIDAVVEDAQSDQVEDKSEVVNMSNRVIEATNDILCSPSPHTDPSERLWETPEDMNPDSTENATLLNIVKSIPTATVHSTIHTTHSQEITELTNDLKSSHIDGVKLENSLEIDLQNPQAQAAPTPELNDQVVFLQKELSHVQCELSKAQSMLTERENQLMTSSASLAKLHVEIETLRNRPNDTNVIYQLQVALADKEMQLKNLLEEGEALSKKQAAFESRLRALRKEKTEVLDENKKLTEALETAQAKWETARMHLIAAEEESKSYAQVMKTLEATETQLHTTEAALTAAKKTLVVMDTQVKELREENDKMKKASQLVAFEDREVLEATIRELQGSLSAQQADASRREDAARNELQAMKARYQEAVNRLDHYTCTTSDATQPLLRQIQLLQEEHRLFEVKRVALEEEHHTRLEEALGQVQEIESLRAIDLKLVNELQEKVKQYDTAQESIRNEMLRYQSEVASVKNQHQQDLILRQQIEQQAKVLAEEKRQMAQLLRSNQDQFDKQVHQHALERDRLSKQIQELQLKVHESTQAVVASTSVPIQPTPQHDQAALLSSIHMIERKPSVEMEGNIDSIVEWQQLQQKVRLRESEAALLKDQLRNMDEARKGANEELVRLTTRNAMLEAIAEEVVATKANLQAMESKQQILLELLGEKDEQVEELETEFREFKLMYQNQIDTLTRR